MNFINTFALTLNYKLAILKYLQFINNFLIVKFFIYYSNKRQWNCLKILIKRFN